MKRTKKDNLKFANQNWKIIMIFLELHNLIHTEISILSLILIDSRMNFDFNFQFVWINKSLTQIYQFITFFWKCLLSDHLWLQYFEYFTSSGRTQFKYIIYEEYMLFLVFSSKNFFVTNFIQNFFQEILQELFSGKYFTIFFKLLFLQEILRFWYKEIFS